MFQFRKLGVVFALVFISSVKTAPPATWREHWFDHVQDLTRVYADQHVAVYFDRDVDRSITWPNAYLSKVWEYTKRTYGQFGTESELYAVFHTGKYSGGHPSTFFDSSHDYHNVIDCGSAANNAWTSGQGNDIDIVTHEVAHIVEGASRGIHNSPAFPIWGDSKWAEIFNMDVYLNIGSQADVDRWFNLMNQSHDNFPRENTYWFRDWFYPVYYNHGKTQVLVNFFNLLAAHFPKNSQGNEYTRNLNWGEFFHFWSGAAGANLKDQATRAFGWTQEYENQFNQAQRDFPNIRY